jgi:hypothetical protein
MTIVGVDVIEISTPIGHHPRGTTGMCLVEDRNRKYRQGPGSIELEFRAKNWKPEYFASLRTGPKRS